MTKSNDSSSGLISGSLFTVLMIAYVGSLPLAIIFGDKWDVVFSIFIPTYGFLVMLGALL